MSKHLVVTTTGHDHIGIVEEVTALLSQFDANIEASRPHLRKTGRSDVPVHSRACIDLRRAVPGTCRSGLSRCRPSTPDVILFLCMNLRGCVASS